MGSVGSNPGNRMTGEFIVSRRPSSTGWCEMRSIKKPKSKVLKNPGAWTGPK